MSIRIGVIGGNGLIARSTWRAALQIPGAGVHVFARTKPAGLPDESDFTPVDLADSRELPDSLSNCDLLINASSCVAGDLASMRKINVDGVQRLIDALALGTGKLLHISTAGVYGTLERSGGVEGEYAVRPESDLSRTRAEGEAIALEAGATVVRPLFVTGIGDHHFLLPLLQAHLMLGAWIQEGAARLSVISADQLTTTAIRVGLRTLDGVTPGVVHAAPTAPISVCDLISPVLKRRGKTFTSTVTVDTAAQKLSAYAIPRRKVEQLGSDYFISSSHPELQPTSEHPVSAEAADWYLSRLS